MTFDLGAQGIETEFIEAGGLRFETLTGGDPTSDRLALLLHGFPELGYSWRNQFPLLARLGYRVWAPNQRGYGATTRPKARDAYRLDLLVEDIAALIDASGAKSVTLMGHDWGGVVAWFFALQGIRPLGRFVVMNMPHPQRFHEALQHKAQRRKSRYTILFRTPWLAEALFRMRGAHLIGEAYYSMAIDKSRFPPEVLDVYKRAALEPGALTAMFNWYRANAFLETFDRDWPVLETPTLMIWGEEDRALGKEMTRGTDRLVRDFTLRRLPNVSHWVQQEAPEAVNEILEAWLTGQDVPAFDVDSAASPDEEAAEASTAQNEESRS